MIGVALLLPLGLGEGWSNIDKFTVCLAYNLIKWLLTKIVDPQANRELNEPAPLQ